MCLIIYKNNKTPVSGFLYKSIIRSYKLRNQDGFGYTLKRDKELYLYKSDTGSIENFIKKLKSLNIKPTDELLIHLRKRSSGTHTIKNIQPQIICDNEHLLELKDITNIKTTGVFAHNGTMTRYNEYNKILSDTSFFNLTLLGYVDAPSFLNNILKLPANDLSGFIQYLTNRFVFMFPKNKTIILGYFKIDKGLFFSNESYLYKDINPTVTNTDYKLYGVDNIKPARFEIVKKFEDITKSVHQGSNYNVSTMGRGLPVHLNLGTWCSGCSRKVYADTQCSKIVCAQLNTHIKPKGSLDYDLHDEYSPRNWNMNGEY